MIYPFNNVIGTIYIYFLYVSYIGTLLFLLRSIYISAFYYIGLTFKNTDYTSLTTQPLIWLIYNSFAYLQNSSFQQRGGENP